ncbi:hypothetical protein [Streptosporangium sp. NPDC003464]
MDRPAPETFAAKTDAEVWLTRKEAEILDDEWTDPDAGKITLGEYGRDWIDERQREVARKLDDLARGALAKGSGTQRARERKKAE